MTKFLSRKFIIALIFTFAGCLALFITDKIDGGQFVTLALGISGLFTAGMLGSAITGALSKLLKAL